MNLLDYVIANHDNLREHSPGCALCRKRAEDRARLLEFIATTRRNPTEETT